MPRRVILLVALAVLSAGCRGEGYKTSLVSGRVTLNGVPVAKVAVMFQPIAPQGSINPGPGSYGITNADGRYNLRLIGKETLGAVVGKHKVRIENYTEPGETFDERPRPREPAVLIPAKYNAVEAVLEFDVSSRGSEAANFDLTDP
jgi:hypothetical protein